ncbi:hypothetical protein K502DRAFT_367053 [Neoconidiobolus thromboides FSU 785]|nr:hypothetical protein K502DRAFT_367053 [Neoconidiobolus thromboides FSU 785]
MGNIYELLQNGDPGDVILGFEEDTTNIKDEATYLIDNFGKIKIKQVLQELKKRGMSTKGGEYLLKNRLRKRLEIESGKTHKKSNFIDEKGWGIPTRYIACIDFEATCEGNVGFDDDTHEIIEFPAVIIDTKTNKIVDEFHSYVKPKLNPILTKYCTDLTGIEQHTIDSSPSFPEVLNSFLEFIKVFNTEDSKIDVSIATHGPSDLERFLLITLAANGLEVPDLFQGDYLDMQKLSSILLNNYKKYHPSSKEWGRFKGRMPSLVTICSSFKIEFKGRNHSGIDDSRAIANVLIYLADICSIRLNAKLK